MLVSSVVLCLLIALVKAKNASVTYDQTTGKFQIHDYIANDPVAYGTFTDEIFKVGWSYLEIKSYEKYPDPIQAYAAGVVEGYLTADLLRKHFSNLVDGYCDGEEIYCQRLTSFLQENWDFIDSNVKVRRKYDVYWHQIALTFEQLHGLEDGYKNVTSQPSTKVDLMGLLLLNIMGDLEDLEVVLKKNDMRRVLGSGHCSGLIKVLPNNKDILFSQVTWSTYTSMLRILKKYSLKLHTSLADGSPVIPGHTSTFSSQPGVLYSGDDFYVLSSGLVAIETTFGNGNDSLWKYVVPQTILEWQRNIIANRLAKTGKQWVTLFGILNSGTYNNQWMVVDYNKFKPGSPLQDGLLYVLEQLPGYLHSEDRTDVLRNQGYWPSYNVAYFKDIFVMSGAQANADKYGDWFTYERNPRALIFQRDHKKVQDIDSMIKLMRYNDYTNDPLSRCNCTPPYSAENAISARCDLNPVNGTYPFAALGHRQHGATDMKLTSYELQKNYEFVAISGPTYDPLPPFQWSKSDFDKKVKHEGHPDLWQFKPIVHKWL